MTHIYVWYIWQKCRFSKTVLEQQVFSTVNGESGCWNLFFFQRLAVDCWKENGAASCGALLPLRSINLIITTTIISISISIRIRISISTTIITISISINNRISISATIIPSSKPGSPPKIDFRCSPQNQFWTRSSELLWARRYSFRDLGIVRVHKKWCQTKKSFVNS